MMKIRETNILCEIPARGGSKGLKRKNLSVAAGADGIMVEVHPDPLNAAVDPLQPIDFLAFKIPFNKYDFKPLFSV